MEVKRKRAMKTAKKELEDNQKKMLDIVKDFVNWSVEAMSGLRGRVTQG